MLEILDFGVYIESLTPLLGVVYSMVYRVVYKTESNDSESTLVVLCPWRLCLTHVIHTKKNQHVEKIKKGEKAKRDENET